MLHDTSKECEFLNQKNIADIILEKRALSWQKQTMQKLDTLVSSK